MVLSCPRDQLLHVEPGELTFPFEVGKQSSCNLRVSNNWQVPVAFKVMTTDFKKYCVVPNYGLILAKSTCDVTVHMQRPKESLSDIEFKDKFKIKSMVARADTTTEDVQKLFEEPGDTGEDVILRVKYAIPPQTKSSSPEIARADDPVNVSSMDEGSINHTEKPSTPYKLLSIEPGELTFPVELGLGKQASCKLLLSNNAEVPVAFKVMTSVVEKYCVRPNNGVILVGSTCEVTVRMKCPEDPLSDVECKDKFLIKSVVARADTTSEDASKLFREPAGGAGEDIKLRVKYVFPFKTKLSNSERADSDASVTVSTVQEGSLERSQLKEPLDADEARWGLNRLEFTVPSQTARSIPLTEMADGPVNASTMQEGSLNSPEVTDDQVLPGQEQNGAPDSDLVRNLVTVGLLGFVLWLIITKVMSLMWSLTFFITMKVINKLVSDSIEDWLLKIVCYLSIHCVSTLFCRNEKTS